MRMEKREAGGGGGGAVGKIYRGVCAVGQKAGDYFQLWAGQFGQ